MYMSTEMDSAGLTVTLKEAGMPGGQREREGEGKWRVKMKLRQPCKTHVVHAHVCFF